MATGFANQASVALELARARADRHARRCSTSASGSPRTCTTTSSNGCSPAACRCRPSRPRSALGRPPTDSGVPWPTSTRRSRRSARRSSSFSRFLRDTARAAGPLAGRRRRRHPRARLRPRRPLRRPDRHPARGRILDLLAVLREALTNTARHAQATAVEVAIIATAQRSPSRFGTTGSRGDTGRRSGLAHLQHRAERHGGALDLGPPRPGRATPPAPGSPGASRSARPTSTIRSDVRGTGLSGSRHLGHLQVRERQLELAHLDDLAAGLVCDVLAHHGRELARAPHRLEAVEGDRRGRRSPTGGRSTGWRYRTLERHDLGQQSSAVVLDRAVDLVGLDPDPGGADAGARGGAVVAVQDRDLPLLDIRCADHRLGGPVRGRPPCRPR